MSIQDYYTETIILLSTSTSDTSGYMDTSTEVIYSTDCTAKACVNQLTGDEVQAYGKIGFDAQYKAYSDVSTEIYEGRRCRWNGDTFVIVNIPKNTVQKGHHYRYLLRDINNVRY